jgi:glutaredoxin 3
MNPLPVDTADGTQMQDYLKSKTGQSTVPSVWIGGKHIGGCDDTHSAAKNGKLKQYLDGASISYASL